MTAVAAAGLAMPGAAQITCRSNTLGAEVCVGVPAPSERDRQPYTPQRRGLAGVQPRPGAASGPTLTPARRTGALGTTSLGAGDLPPGRPPLPGIAPVRVCARDALGNLICR